VLRDGVGVKVVVIDVLHKSNILEEPCVFTRHFLRKSKTVATSDGIEEVLKCDVNYSKSFFFCLVLCQAAFSDETKKHG
jgi:hypothetical protein